MLDQILVISGVTFLIMISPGPDMVIVMRNTLLGGRGAGLRTSLGVLVGNLVHIAYCVLGIGLVISQSIMAFTMLKYAGAAYLIYLGISSFSAAPETPSPESLEPDGKNRTWFMQGFVNNILNPKGTLFYLGIFTVVITPETSVAGTLVLITVMQSICAAFWIVFVLTLDQPVFRRWIDRSQRVVSRTFGALLVFLGLRVLTMAR